jgi:membrane-bound inhibitor of C-type lysozyme
MGGFMTMRVIALVAFVTIAAASGSSLAADVSYACSGGTHLMASFSPPGVSPGSAVIVFAGSNVKVSLPQVMSADGGRYADKDLEFWIRGTDATLTRAGRTEKCHSK